MKQTEHSGTKKGKGLTALFFVLLALTLGVIFGKIFGVRLYAVTTSSMENALRVGDLAVVAKTDFANLNEGDIITFYLNEKLDTATHRIFSVNAAAETFITKGDKNDAADGKPVLYGNVVGKVYFSVPKLGYGLVYFSTFQGKVTLAALLLVFVILLFARSDDKKTQTVPPGGDETAKSAEAAKSEETEKSEEAATSEETTKSEEAATSEETEKGEEAPWTNNDKEGETE